MVTINEYYEAVTSLHNYADALKKNGYNSEFIATELRKLAQHVVSQYV